MNIKSTFRINNRLALCSSDKLSFETQMTYKLIFTNILGV